MSAAVPTPVQQHQSMQYPLAAPRPHFQNQRAVVSSHGPASGHIEAGDMPTPKVQQLAREVTMPSGGEFANDSGERTITVRNLPAAWIAPNTSISLHAEIKKKLEEFGNLEGLPVISRTPERGVCVIAKFVEKSAAQAAVEMMDGRDNRGLPRGAKWQADYRPPQEHEKFSVSLAMGNITGSKSKQQVGLAAGVRSSKGSATIILSAVPADWGETDVMELCDPYGEVKSVSGLAEEKCMVTFFLSQKAERAAVALNGLQVPNQKGDLCHLQCELVPLEAAARDPVEPKVANSTIEKKGPRAEERSPFMICFDELLAASGVPSSSDREVYLRNLPLEDCSERELRDWLNGFGMVDDATFLRDCTTEQLTGCAYVRFALHSDAAAMTAAYPIDDEGGDVQGTWSLSERVLNSARGAADTDALKLLVERLEQLRVSTRCPSLTIVGDGCEGKPSLGLLGTYPGPLRFAWLREDTGHSTDALRTSLKDALREVALKDQTLQLEGSTAVENVNEPSAQASVPDEATQPNDARRRRRKRRRAHGERAGTADAGSSSASILVRGFPAKWTDRQVRLIFAAFGGVESVHFTKDVEGTAALVKLKNIEKTAEVVAKINNTQVGDGEILEKCQVTCKLVESARTGSVHKSDLEAADAARRPGSCAPKASGPGAPGAFGPTYPPPAAPPLGWQVPPHSMYPYPPGVPYPTMGMYAPVDPAFTPQNSGQTQAEVPKTGGVAVAPDVGGTSAVQHPRERDSDRKCEEPVTLKENHEKSRKRKKTRSQERHFTRPKASGRKTAKITESGTSKHSARVKACPDRCKSDAARGVALIHEARRLRKSKLHKEAYEKYVLGLQRLLRLDKTQPKAQALQKRVAKYIGEAEKLKAILETNNAVSDDEADDSSEQASHGKRARLVARRDVPSQKS